MNKTLKNIRLRAPFLSIAKSLENKFSKPLLFWLYKSVFFLVLLMPLTIVAQTNLQAIDGTLGQGTSRSRTAKNDSLGNGEKVIPIGIKVWTVDTRFGDRTQAVVDTASHMFPNTIFTSGLRGEYNTRAFSGRPAGRD